MLLDALMEVITQSGGLENIEEEPDIPEEEATEDEDDDSE